MSHDAAFTPVVGPHDEDHVLQRNDDGESLEQGQTRGLVPMSPTPPHGRGRRARPSSRAFIMTCDTFADIQLPWNDRGALVAIQHRKRSLFRPPPWRILAASRPGLHPRMVREILPHSRKRTKSVDSSPPAIRSTSGDSARHDTRGETGRPQHRRSSQYLLQRTALTQTSSPTAHANASFHSADLSATRRRRCGPTPSACGLAGAVYRNSSWLRLTSTRRRPGSPAAISELWPEDLASDLHRSRSHQHRRRDADGTRKLAQFTPFIVRAGSGPAFAGAVLARRWSNTAGPILRFLFLVVRSVA